MRRLAGALAVGLLVALTTTPAHAAPAAPGAPAAPAAAAVAGITLLEQPAWATLGGDMPFRLALTGQLAGLEVRATVHSAMTSRTGFERTVEGEKLGSTVATTSAPVTALPAAPNGGRLLTLHLQDPNLARDPNRLRLPMPRGSRTGVFPVEIELRDPESGQRVASFVTHLVAVAPAIDGAPLGEPLNVAWIWNIAANPATSADGKVRAGFLAAISPTGRLTRLATAASRSVDVPLTLAPGPETAESWNQQAKTNAPAAAGISALRSAARSQQVLTGPYVQIDIPSLIGGGLGDEASLELAQGSVTLGQVLNTRVDGRSTNVEPLNSAALDRLELSQVDRVVVSPSALVPPAQAPQFTPAQPFTLEAGNGRQFSAAQTDDGLEHLLEGEGSPALRAAHFLAGLAIVAMEQPNETRGLVIDTPTRWDPPAALLNAVLKGLGDNPLLAPVTLDELFDHVPLEQVRRGVPLTRQLAPINSPPPPVTAKKYATTRNNLTAFASTVGAGDPAITSGNRALLISLTSSYPGALGRRHGAARLAAINTGIQAFANLIKVPPTGLTVTLTSRTADLPLSFNNETGQVVRVRVKLSSDKLQFPKGTANSCGSAALPDGRCERTITLPPRNRTVRFPVETRASGTFPLRVTVTTEDGRLALHASRYTVRSTVVSGVGVFLTIGAVVFLAIWWITHWRRSRRQPLRPASLAT